MLLIRDPAIKRETRLLFYRPLKAIREDNNVSDYEDNNSRPIINLIRDLPISLFAKPITRIPTLKATNYYI